MRVEGSVVFLIEFEPDPAAGREMLGQVVEKEVPLWNLPKVRHFVIVEANHKSGDEVEFLSKIGQRPKCFDMLDYTTNTEQARNLPEHGQTVHIKTESRMTEQLSDVEEIPCAAAKVEDPLGTRQIEFDLANPANIDSDPTVEI